ncbi:MAG TPA: YlbF family regulator [Candidatus Acidoferrum sp.]|nr:YlbF family regulator [Candidatus Acidoferrum sp.]
MQTAIENPVAEKTRELCQTILSQPEFQNVRRDVESFMNNDRAKAQYETLSEKGEHLHHKQHQGVALSPDEIDEYEKLRTSFLADPVARGFLNAQEKMQEVQQTIGQYVSKTLELGRVPTDEDFEKGESCGSGCGCH